jgi:hypothetical protein
MALSIEWRIRPDADTVLIVEDDAIVRVALPADAQLLTRMLTEPGDLGAWEGGKLLEAIDRDPSVWGKLVISRSDAGQIVTMDPELFWNGVYEWFRSRGVDYDSFVS